MKNLERIEKLGITSKEEFEGVKKDYRDCKERVDRLEWFLTKLVDAYQSEYTCC